MRARWLLPFAFVAVAGCGTADDRDEARVVVERFYDAVRDDRPEEACTQLAESALEQLESQTGRECKDVIVRLEYEGGAVVDAHVYITNAKVDLTSGESAFLDREPTGWKLSAIGCKVQGGNPRDRPFDCEVEA